MLDTIGKPHKPRSINDYVVNALERMLNFEFKVRAAAAAVGLQRHTFQAAPPPAGDLQIVSPREVPERE
ncbi:MAG: hypothetical protein AB7U75_07025 [Hyphomicrobiaceae bacterium]